MHAILQTVVAAVVLGMVAQVLAHRFKLPAILPLLLLGMLGGPFGLGLFDPSSLGHGLEVVLHLGVAVILFEGGLLLDLHQLRQVSGPLRNLLTVGTAVTGVGSAALAHYCIGVSWPTASLFGAIVTVTGPTVIAPLLRHMVAPKKVRTILLSEGLMIDPIGAVLAYLVLQWIERANMGWRPMAVELLELCVTGSILGLVAGFLAMEAIRRRALGEELRNLVILALLFGAFFWAEEQAPTSGILAAVVMGLVVSFAQLPDLSPLKAFKGQLTVLFISVLFILLSGKLDLEAVGNLGGPGVLVVAGMILLVRPLSVFLSVPGRQLDLKEKTILALTAPRGIVAAAVASLSAISLSQHGRADDAIALEGLVYLVILVTCAWATLMAKILPGQLGYLDDPSRRKVVLVGMNELTFGLGKLFRNKNWTVTIIDGVRDKLKPLREHGIVGVADDARDAVSYDKAGVERDTIVVAVTTNDELNLLTAELLRNEFGIEHPVVSLQRPSSELGQLRHAWVDVLGSREIDLPRWIGALRKEEAELRTVTMPKLPAERQALQGLIADHPRKIAILFGWKSDKPTFDFEDELPDAQELTFVLYKDLLDELAAVLEPAPEPEQEAPDLTALATEMLTELPDDVKKAEVEADPSPEVDEQAGADPTGPEDERS